MLRLHDNLTPSYISTLVVTLSHHKTILHPFHRGRPDSRSSICVFCNRPELVFIVHPFRNRKERACSTTIKHTSNNLFVYILEACRVTFLLTNQLSFEKSCVLNRHVLVWTGVLVFLLSRIYGVGTTFHPEHWMGCYQISGSATDMANLERVLLLRIHEVLSLFKRPPHKRRHVYLFQDTRFTKGRISCCFDPSNLKEMNELRQRFR